jgi:hypothetical protein
MILWLDDVRKPWEHGFVGADWAKNYDEAIKLLQTHLVTFASLDHDLSEQAALGEKPEHEKTGYDVVCWLEEHPQYWPPCGVIVHSMNPVGKARMEQVIKKHYESLEYHTTEESLSRNK